MELVNEYGFHNTSTSKIAKKAGFSEATIYKHFCNKEKLLIEVYLSIKSDLDNSLKISEIKDTNPRETLKIIFGNYLNYFLDNENSLNYYLQFINSNYMNQIVFDKGIEFLNDLFELIDQFEKNGYIKKRVLSFYNIFVNAPILELARLKANKELIVNEKIIDEVLSNILNTIFN